MYKTDVFISAEEIKEIVGISKSKACYSVDRSRQATVMLQVYDLCSVSSFFESRMVILPRESLTRPSP